MVLDSRTRKGSAQREKREEYLSELAKWPKDAHKRWKHLTDTDRATVVFKMAARYGDQFVLEFLKHRERGRYKEPVPHTIGNVPRALPTPETLTARGYKLAQQDGASQWWVNSEGRTITRIIFQGDVPGGAGTTGVTPVPPPGPGPVDEDPAILEARGYVEVLENTKNELEALADELWDKFGTDAEGTEEYKDLTKKYEDIVKAFDNELLQGLKSAKERLPKEVQTPDGLDRLNEEIERLEQLQEWREIFAPAVPEVDLPSIPRRDDNSEAGRDGEEQGSHEVESLEDGLRDGLSDLGVDDGDSLSAENQPPEDSLQDGLSDLGVDDEDNLLAENGPSEDSEPDDLHDLAGC